MLKEVMIIMPRFSGGAEKVVSNIIKNIDLSKFKLTVVSIHDEDINIFEGLNINYHCLQKKTITCHPKYT